jgi:hypothetical protein
MIVILKPIFNRFITLKIVVLLFLTCLLLPLSTLISLAQDSPVEVSGGSNRTEAGLMLGLGQNIQSGSYFVDCEGCEFMDGTKFGYSLGFFYEYSLNQNFLIGAMGIYDDMSIVSSYIEIEPVELQNTSLGNNIVDVAFRHESEFGLSSFSIAPYIKWNFTKNFFIRSAFAAGFATNSSLSHSKSLLDRFITLSNGEVVEVTLEGSDDNTAILQDGDAEGVNDFYMAVLPAIGAEFGLSKRATLGSSFQYNIPLTTVYENGDSFGINQWRIFVEFSYAITLSFEDLKN